MELERETVVLLPVDAVGRETELERETDGSEEGGEPGGKPAALG